MKTIERSIILLLLFLGTGTAFGQWVHVGNFANARTIVAADGRLVLSRADSGVFISTNNGVIWEQMNTGITGPVTAFGAIGGRLFAATTGQGVFVMQPGSSTWQAVDSELPSGVLARGFLTVNNDLYMYAYQGLFKSTDMGVSWMSLNEGLGNTSIWAVDVHDSTITVGTYEGLYQVMNPDSMFAALPGVPGAMIYSLMTSNDQLFIGTNQGLFVSTNGGNAWTNIGFSISDSNIFALTANPSILFVGSEGTEAVFVTSDGGLTWSLAAPGLPNTFVNSLAISGNTLYAATDAGLFATSITGSGVDIGSTDGDFTLSVSPNPVTTNLKLSYTLNKATRMRITISDALGRRVTTLFEGSGTVGEHLLNADISHLAAGNYYCELTADTQHVVRKLIVLR